jgi:hypothetical protein
MEVIAPAFFDLRSSRGPQRLLESAIWKTGTGAQTVWNFDLCCFSDPHYFQISSGVSFIIHIDHRSSRGTYGVKCCKWGVLCHISIGLKFFPIFKNNLFFCNHI